MSPHTETLYRSLCALPADEVASVGARLVREVWSRAGRATTREYAAPASGGQLVAPAVAGGVLPVETAAYNNTLAFAEREWKPAGAGEAVERACAAAPVFAASALAEARKADFATLFHAAGLGMEAYSRLATSVARGAARKAFDGRVIAATLASIVACAYIEQLTPGQAAQALGLGSSAVTSMAQGHLPLQAATAARDGIVMVLLMRCGFRGPPDSLGCRWGVYETFGDPADMGTLDVSAAGVHAGDRMRRIFGETTTGAPAQIALRSPVSMMPFAAGRA